MSGRCCLVHFASFSWYICTLVTYLQNEYGGIPQPLRVMVTTSTVLFISCTLWSVLPITAIYTAILFHFFRCKESSLKSRIVSFQVTKLYSAPIQLLLTFCWHQWTIHLLASRVFQSSCIWFFCPSALCEWEPRQLAFFFGSTSQIGTQNRGVCNATKDPSQFLHFHIFTEFYYCYYSASRQASLQVLLSVSLIKPELRRLALKSQQFW